jgi:hypothetical protein
VRDRRNVSVDNVTALSEATVQADKESPEPDKGSNQINEQCEQSECSSSPSRTRERTTAEDIVEDKNRRHDSPSSVTEPSLTLSPPCPRQRSPQLWRGFWPQSEHQSHCPTTTDIVNEIKDVLLPELWRFEAKILQEIRSVSTSGDRVGDEKKHSQQILSPLFSSNGSDISLEGDEAKVAQEIRSVSASGDHVGDEKKHSQQALSPLFSSNGSDISLEEDNIEVTRGQALRQACDALSKYCINCWLLDPNMCTSHQQVDCRRFFVENAENMDNWFGDLSLPTGHCWFCGVSLEVGISS